MTAVDAPAPSRPRRPGFGKQVAALTGRSLRAFVSDPRAVALGAVGPILTLVILSQVFGSIADAALLPDGVGYLDYLTPAILVTTAVSAAQVSGQAFLRDMGNGVFDRLRSLPVRLAVLPTARSLADVVRYTAQAALVVAAALVLGFTVRPGLAAAFVVAVGLAWALVWAFLALAVWVRSAEVLQSLGVLLFPVMFTSSAFAPVERLPAWLGAAATVNPLTYAIDAIRALALGRPAAPATAVGVIALLGAVSAAVTIRAFTREPA
ncbi:ABC transporter permease [Actinokineospora iranica]|uniref:Transport permease protein n=1 Tax=Actinokineospora iranica TaxID=1271860 RepID=A0A1G6U5L1_9PSEU|nr:ABC transporter permease [Actinokineospora iranica]SDD36571.1 ABC-2 type transport system permease protein [Actinokineospora iranica]